MRCVCEQAESSIFDLDDTLYTSFQAGDRYAYECMEKWAQETFGEAGHGFDAAF